MVALRYAGQLYAAWRDASPSVRERILEDPELFLKVRRQHSPDPPAPLLTQLRRDLQIVVAITRRQNRYLVGATVSLDPLERAQIHGQIDWAQRELQHLANKIPQVSQEDERVESEPTDHDSGIACPRSEQTRDCTDAEDQPPLGAQSFARELGGRTAALASGEGRTLPPANPGTARQPQRESVRVREELEARGVSLAYSTLTAFCHRHGIGQQPVLPSGNYDFLPGEEMQHDTSPHEVELGGQRRKVQTASAVLCYSRMLFFQMYPTFTRFDAKVFLTDALCYFGGVVAHVVIDNMWWCCAAPAAKWCPFPRWLLLPSASASASWLTSSEMRTVRLASNAPFGLSSGTSWPGAASSTGGI
jgi:hypothetical protein